ncbi:AraC family transcriptional regulator [Parapedobacter sp. DT-150]|uniref:AraC family transcriptional regulator n=1 Tax=Parapedobacter sp. DT-150 TaxID=3396162 RepID=UPI003F1AB437
MKSALDVRDFYRPLQPTVEPSGGPVSYVELLPDRRLLPFIYRYWELKTKEPLQERFTYRVVADGCIDIFFEPGRREECFVTGFCKQYTAFQLERTFHYVGVRFLPTMFPQLFRINASLLSNRTEPLDAVVPTVARFLADHMVPVQSTEVIIQKLNAFFLHHVAHHDIDNDRRLYGALATIIQTSGMLNVERDIDSGVSPRQLRRLFQFYIGDTAKTFSKVVRFQHALRANNLLCLDAGYYDQAHFIKEFKHFYGVTPGRVFGR